jgi:uncharacterized membrane protein YebE (DUF533 family)
MEQELTHPKYLYADILIALAHADGAVDARERAALDQLFARMGLDRETVADMWLTPRPLEVVATWLEKLPDQQFRNCLLKDCYQLALADQRIAPAEHRFLRALSQVMQIPAPIYRSVLHWVDTDQTQQRKARDLFGGEDLGLHT